VNRPARRTVLAACVASTLTACADTPLQNTSGAASPSVVPATTTPPRRAGTTPDPRAVKANELGVIPVLMYHRLTNRAAGEYDMTPAFFRAQLERLYRENYHPIRAVDLARGLIRVPAGKTPCVLTFDDSTAGQFGYDRAGRISAASAAGILLDFARRRPGFPAVATLYLNKLPFGLSGAAAVRAVRDLTAHGFEVGNHTWSHANLENLDDRQVQAEIGRLAEFISQAVPEHPARTLALPLGVHPRNRQLMITGASKGSEYRNDAVLLVGANPCLSPFHRDFDPHAIPRIRVTSYRGGTGRLLSTYWLDELAAHPEKKYISAGNPSRITFPRALAAEAAPRLRGRITTY